MFITAAIALRTMKTSPLLNSEWRGSFIKVLLQIQGDLDCICGDGKIQEACPRALLPHFTIITLF